MVIMSANVASASLPNNIEFPNSADSCSVHAICEYKPPLLPKADEIRMIHCPTNQRYLMDCDYVASAFFITQQSPHARIQGTHDQMAVALERHCT